MYKTNFDKSDSQLDILTQIRSDLTDLMYKRKSQTYLIGSQKKTGHDIVIIIINVTDCGTLQCTETHNDKTIEKYKHHDNWVSIHYLSTWQHKTNTTSDKIKK